MSGSGEAGRRGGQDTAQISDCERKQIKGDIPGMSKIPKLTTWTQHVIREASSMAGAILGFPAAGFSVPRAPALAGHSPRCSCPDPLVLGPGATSPITERLTHLGWAVWSDQTAGQQQQQLDSSSSSCPPLPPSKRITEVKATVEKGRLFRPAWRARSQFALLFPLMLISLFLAVLGFH